VIDKRQRFLKQGSVYFGHSRIVPCYARGNWIVSMLVAKVTRKGAEKRPVPTVHNFFDNAQNVTPLSFVLRIVENKITYRVVDWASRIARDLRLFVEAQRRYGKMGR
jgi:hypothetical protein